MFKASQDAPVPIGVSFEEDGLGVQAREGRKKGRGRRKLLLLRWHWLCLVWLAAVPFFAAAKPTREGKKGCRFGGIRPFTLTF